MKDIERDFLEEKIKLPFEQVVALITTIRILAEDDGEDAKDRRVRLTYLLDDVTQAVKERFDNFIDSLYSGGEGGEEEKISKEICDFRKNHTVIEMLRRYGRNTRRKNNEAGDAHQYFSGMAAEDYALLQKFFGVVSVGYGDGIATADKDLITYTLNINDEDQNELGAEPRHFIGGNANENHA